MKVKEFKTDTTNLKIRSEFTLSKTLLEKKYVCGSVRLKGVRDSVDEIQDLN